MAKTTLNERIVELMKFLNITPALFADEIGVQRSGITHIINGRNKPSLDMVMKILDCYPDVNMDWLLKGKGQISSSTPNVLTMQQKNSIPTEPIIDNSLKNTLFDSEEPIKHVETKRSQEVKFSHHDFIEENSKSANMPPVEAVSEAKEMSFPHFVNENKPEKKITKIVVFFSDNSFQELV